MIKIQNEFKIGFEPTKHQYTVTKDSETFEVASWTGVCDLLDKSSGLLPWAVNCAVKYIKENGLTEETLDKAKKEWRTVKDEACDIGSEVHGIIERYIKFGKDTLGELRPEVENAFLAFLEWEKTTGVEWIASECRVYNPSVGVAGCFDAIGRIKGEYILIDFKSSKGFYDTFPIQLGGYLSCLNHYTLPFEMSHAGILRLDKETGVPEWKEYRDCKRYIDTAEIMAKLFYMLKKRRLKNNPFVKAYHP
jgi:hypothetical protein